ncbi:MAG: hypothetical protein FWE07_08500 [Turicibacter sp.]|nr:hypothetical protein [Turicibacter sp.]
MTYIIGIDGGGTKTEAVAFDTAGNVLATGLSGPGKVLVNFEAAARHTTDAVRQCMDKLFGQTCTHLYLGLAGIDSGVYRDELAEKLQEFGIPFCMLNDAQLAHAAQLKGKDGILTIAGTGSVSYGLKDGRFEMVGGWGHLLGDEGSGYWIAIESFKRMIGDHDAGKPVSTLSARLLKELGLVLPPDIKRFVYTEAKDRIASVVPVIAQLASDGDRVAAEVLTAAGNRLADMTLSLHVRLGFEGEVLLAMRGGVLTQIGEVREAFLKRVDASGLQVKFLDDEVSATLGAYYLHVAGTG